METAKPPPIEIEPNTSACCYSKKCKVTTPANDPNNPLVKCSEASCRRFIHRHCAEALLQEWGDNDGSDQGPLCSKRCYNLVSKKKSDVKVPRQGERHRIPWHNDGPTEALSSISLLIEWLNIGETYRDWRGADSNTGKTKAVMANHFLQWKAAKGNSTPRNSKQVITKVGQLESDFRRAEDWKRSSGQGTMNEANIDEIILSMCPYYHRLKAIMLDRASTNAPCTELTMLDSDTDSSFEATSTNNDKTMASSTSSPQKKRPSTVPTSVQKRRKPTISDTHLNNALIQLKREEIQEMQELKKTELKFRQQEAEARTAATGFNKEVATETCLKLKEERIKLKEEGRLARYTASITLLRERKKLLQEGVDPEEIDALLPLFEDSNN